MVTTRSQSKAKHEQRRKKHDRQLNSFLAGRECGLLSHGSSASAAKELAVRLPGALQEHRLAKAFVRGIDKAFAGCWVDERTILLGTKRNVLLEVDVPTDGGRHVELPQAPPGPRSHVPPPDAQHPWQLPSCHCGIHAVQLNPCRSLLATGGEAAQDVTVLRVEGAATAHRYEPVQTFVGHADWVFGIAWLTNTHFATGSRDGTVKLWQVEDGGSGTPYNAARGAPHTSVEVNPPERVRALAYGEEVGRLVSLGSEGCCVVWDSELRRARKVRTPADSEFVSCAMSSSLLAVGSRSCVAVHDVRCEQRVATLPYLRGPGYEDTGGVRSICFHPAANHLMSIGGCCNDLRFVDLRRLQSSASTVASFRASAAAAAYNPQLVPMLAKLDLSDGFLDPDSQLFEVTGVFTSLRNACYAQEWSPSGTSLLVAGGPLLYGASGCYAGVWK